MFMLELVLKRAGLEDANKLWEMQTRAFQELYEKYQDTDTSPATEPLEKIIARLEQPFTYYYFIEMNHESIGAVRVVNRNETGKPKRISPIFVMPEHRNQGIASRIICEIEKIHGSDDWELETILQEPGNCHLYEKAGYFQTDKKEQINERMTLVTYRKG